MKDLAEKMLKDASVRNKKAAEKIALSETSGTLGWIG